jgi:hypothetical protein
MSRNDRPKRRAKPEAKPTHRPAKKPMTREEFLKLAFSVVKDKLSSAGRQNLQANFELQYDYPDEYVAFFDEWEGEGRKRRLHRRLLGHSPDMGVISDLIVSLSPEDRLRVQFQYVHDPFTGEVLL